MELQRINLGKVAITVERDRWSPTKDYDKLVIINGPIGINKTFISRKPVPVGTSLDNRTYWIPIVDLDGKFTKIEEDIAELRELIGQPGPGGQIINIVQVLGTSTNQVISQKIVTDYINSLQNDINSLQLQINNIILDNATFNLIISPSKILIDTNENISLTATSSINCDSIIFYKKENNNYEQIGEGNTDSKTATYTDNVYGSTPKTINYKVEFKIGDITKSIDKNLTIANPIFYGYGENSNNIIRTKSTNTSISGTYTISVATNTSHIYFLIPSGNTITSAIMGALPFPITFKGTLENGYKLYESDNTYDAGTYNITLT